MVTILSNLPAAGDIEELMGDLLDQIDLMNLLCEHVSIRLEPRHNHNQLKKNKNRSTASKQRKRRIFSSSEDDSSSSSDDSLVSGDNHTLIMGDSDDDDEQKALRSRHGPRTRHELTVDDLPPIENLTITLSDETPIERIGYIRHIIEGKLVIIEALLHSPPLNDDSVLFNQNRRSIGLVFETFGPVEKPYYSIRYNDVNNVHLRHIELNQEVFYAPKETTYTKYVFVQELRTFKGSDASWEDDNEPPRFAIDYSDDEQERTAKAILKGKRALEDNPNEQMTDSTNTKKTNSPSTYNHIERGRGCGRHQGFRRGGPDRPSPNLPNWFQNTSSATSSQYRPNIVHQHHQQSSSSQSNTSIASTLFSFSSVAHSDNTNPSLQSTQQAVHGNNSTRSVFPWM